MQGNECFLYSFRPETVPITVVEANPEEEQLVAIKTTVPDDTCPASYKNLTFTFISESGSSYSWTNTNNTWTFSTCQTDWKRFDRATVSVCMKGVYMGTTVTKVTAQEACQNISAVMIGVESVEEAEWMQEEIKRLNAPDRTSFWIDGERNCTPTTESHCDNYTWTNTLTSPSDVLKSSIAAISYTDTDGSTPEPCLAAYYRTDKQFIFNDIQCSLVRQTGTICGYKLM